MRGCFFQSDFPNRREAFKTCNALEEKKDAAVGELSEAAAPPPAMSQPSQGQKPVFAMAPDEEALTLFRFIWLLLARGWLLSLFISRSQAHLHSPKPRYSNMRALRPLLGGFSL